MTPEIFAGVSEHHKLKYRKLIGFRTMETNEKKKIEIILDEVCKFYELDLSKVIAKGRIRKYAEGRQVCAFLGRELTNLTFQDIGTLLGGRDHATMIHSYNKTADRLSVEKAIRIEVDILIKTVEKRFRNDGLI